MNTKPQSTMKHFAPKSRIKPQSQTTVQYDSKLQISVMVMHYQHNIHEIYFYYHHIIWFVLMFQFVPNKYWFVPFVHLVRICIDKFVPNGKRYELTKGTNCHNIVSRTAVKLYHLLKCLIIIITYLLLYNVFTRKLSLLFD